MKLPTGGQHSRDVSETRVVLRNCMWGCWHSKSDCSATAGYLGRAQQPRNTSSDSDMTQTGEKGTQERAAGLSWAFTPSTFFTAETYRRTHWTALHRWAKTTTTGHRRPRLQPVWARLRCRRRHLLTGTWRLFHKPRKIAPSIMASKTLFE